MDIRMKSKRKKVKLPPLDVEDKVKVFIKA
jgi:hypothetical protein